MTSKIESIVFSFYTVYNFNILCLKVNIMKILNKFENLANHALFASNKDNILKSMGLVDTYKDKNSQKIRDVLTTGSKQFADMSRVAR